MCEPSQKGFSFECPQPQNFGFSRVSVTLPSASTMSTVPVKRIDPLFGFMKTLLFSIFKYSAISQGSREEPGYVMDDEALTLSLIRSDEYVHE